MKPTPMTTMTVIRLLLITTGLVLAAVGVEHLLTETRAGTARDVLLWATATLVLHDGALAPATLATGLLLAGTKLRGVWRAGLLTAGAVTLVALPVLLRPGRPTDPSVLPLNYPLGLATVLTVIAVVTAATAAWHHHRRHRRRSPQPEPERGARGDAGDAEVGAADLGGGREA
ncbi:hypothetical protein O7599_22980 [Streptomyces sp. WMMC500]|uniref:hypothetical protein n=1 Tax=Streptomyces sp. WMMC500 TaxID=3015154 RepID=UPI00248C4E13|nr:hypothetical protein [Streptomyces sp. WMMC500]WBB58490.1 hypothetical protein O7599_22980 [Streptomyces sp. WMMC500]